MSYSDVPLQLLKLDNWIVWRKEKRNNKETKVPYDARFPRDLKFAKTNDASTWVSFSEAAKAADILSGTDFDGIGFILTGTPFVGIDFDGVVEPNGLPEPYATSILRVLGNPYTEITPSKTGLRCFVECPTLPPAFHGQPRNKFNGKKKGVDKYGIEIYAGDGGGRYLTVTGDKFSGKDIPKVNLELAYFLISRFPDEHFKRMWIGDSSDYANDDSRLDLALLGYLARALNGDKDKVLDYFSASVPGHREKWMDREDYRERTVTKALSDMVPPDEPQPRKRGKTAIIEPRMPLVFHKDSMGDAPFDFVISPLGDRRDGWFPLGSPSLIGGSSGSGKSTLMFDLLVVQAMKAPFYGHGTNGYRYLVLMLDRGSASNIRTMHRMGFSQQEIPVKFLDPVLDDKASQEIINKIEECDPMPQIVFIEGIDLLVSDAACKQIVMPFMRELQQISTHFHIAMVGSTGAPKTKQKEGYTAKRDTIFGSEVWSRMSETIVTLQYPEGDDMSSQRIMSVLLRNASPERFTVEFMNGRLTIVDQKEEKVLPPKVQEAVFFLEENLQGGKPVLSSFLHSKCMGTIRPADMREAARYLRDAGRLVSKETSKKDTYLWQLVEMHAGTEMVPQTEKPEPDAIDLLVESERAEELSHDEQDPI